MKKFMLFVAFAAGFGPVAAFAASAPVPVRAVMISTRHSNDLTFQLAHLNGQILALNNEVADLERQTAPGTGYVAELGGVIPSGG